MTKIRVLDLVGDPVELGSAHGAAYAAEIRDYTQDRIERSVEGTGWTSGQLLAVVEETLPAHEAYSPDLCAELSALAEAAQLTPAEAVVVGGYTDVIDLVRARAGAGPTADTCTAVVVPDHRSADGAGYLAQTWDMHASATPHIVMLRLAPIGKPRALVFTTVGCLGQIGMNDAGIAIGINNLTAADGKVGVTWPFVVRKALEQTNFDAALEAVTSADLAGGHSFLLLAADGRGAVVEAMPTTRHVFSLDSEPLVHTNHCLVPGTQAVEGPRPEPLQVSSLQRLAHATELLSEGLVDADDLIALTRDERAICRHPEPPYDYESCGAAICQPRTGAFWACWGVPSEHEYERFDLEVTVGG